MTSKICAHFRGKSDWCMQDNPSLLITWSTKSRAFILRHCLLLIIRVVPPSILRTCRGIGIAMILDSKKLLQPSVLGIQRLKFPSIGDFHATKLRLPLIKRLSAWFFAPNDIGIAYARFLFLQDLNDLLFSKSLLHMSDLSRSDSTERLTSFRSSGHRV